MDGFGFEDEELGLAGSSAPGDPQCPKCHHSFETERGLLQHQRAMAHGPDYLFAEPQHGPHHGHGGHAGEKPMRTIDLTLEEEAPSQRAHQISHQPQHRLDAEAALWNAMSAVDFSSLGPGYVAAPPVHSAHLAQPPAHGVPHHAPHAPPPPAAARPPPPLYVMAPATGAARPAGSKRARYKCGKCGLEKKGHTCGAAAPAAEAGATPAPAPAKRAAPAIAPGPAPAPARAPAAPAPDPSPFIAYAGPHAPAAPRPSKKARNAVPDAAAPVVEKRLAKFRSSIPKGMHERIARAKTQRLFLISRKPGATPLEQSFTVLGSIGNVYEVKISHQPSCTCPDGQKGNLCKHVLFVYLKVLRVPPDSPYIYQLALLSSELEEIFQRAPKDPTAAVLADEAVLKKYSEVTGEKALAAATVTRQPIKSDPCPICYEDLNESEEILWCKTGCGHNVHAVCFGEWSKAKHKELHRVTCVYCRAEWAEPGPIHKVPKKLVGEEGYLNLGSFQHDLPQERDYSEYEGYGKWF